MNGGLGCHVGQAVCSEGDTTSSIAINTGTTAVPDWGSCCLGKSQEEREEPCVGFGNFAWQDSGWFL